MSYSKSFLYKKNRVQQIKGFYNAVLYKSISKASKVMNLTQSTVTLQIQSLERDLGFKLINRNTKPLSLTNEGEEFYKSACPLIQEFDSIIENFLIKKKEKRCNKVDIAVHHIAISYLMPSIVRIFKIKYPNVKIFIRNLSPSEALKRLKEEEIDLAFYPNCTQEPEIEQITSVAYDPILIMNKNHPLNKIKIKNLQELKKFDLIKIDQNLITLPLFKEVVRNYDLQGSIEFENGNWEMLKSFVKKNNLIAIVSQMCLDENNDLAVKNLRNFFPKMSYSILYKKGKILEDSAKHFIHSIQKLEEERY
jgi:DNA-binding transcriptional LysR family regulator